MRASASGMSSNRENPLKFAALTDGCSLSILVWKISWRRLLRVAFHSGRVACFLSCVQRSRSAFGFGRIGVRKTSWRIVFRVACELFPEPLQSKGEENKTIKAMFGPGLSGKSPSHLSSCSLYARKRHCGVLGIHLPRLCLGFRVWGLGFGV